MPYDPKKAHDYYERTKKLKGRDSGQAPPPKVGLGSRVVSDGANSSRHVSKAHATTTQAKLDSAGEAARQRVVRLKSAVSKLQGALSQAQAALVKARAAAQKTAKDNSDGKSTAQEKQSSKQYRDKNKAKLAATRKETSTSTSSSSSSSGSSSSSSTSTSSVSSMSVAELETRIINIKSALSDAKSQLSNASQQLGQLAHSAITSEPTFNEHFARFRSAERRPST